MTTPVTVTCTAPVNIAVVKYWGKRDTALNLPTNSSLSVTLSQDRMFSKTTAQASPDFIGDKFWLNGVETDIASNPRMVQCLAECRRLRQQQEEEDGTNNTMWRWGLRIASTNSFPTAAGLASSASGYACFVKTLAELYELRINADVLSGIARRGSGSACRSLQGGFVAWDCGVLVDGTDSIARQVATREHWPELEAIICVVNAGRKDTPSTIGMQRTVATSELFVHRLTRVPERMQAMEAAIIARDFPSFARLTMQDSNQFHACCLDTVPPVVYLSDVSHAIIRLVEAFNRGAKGIRAAYTFDAGPNAVIYTLREHVPDLLSTLVHCFPTDNMSSYFDDPYQIAPAQLGRLTSLNDIDPELNTLPVHSVGQVKQLLHVRVGDGPQVLDASHHLLNQQGQLKSNN
ncbi:diphosphomevalonate decarboxylase [Syncephalis plumigaleata]|nr:diphosphomevalonate decarboxylase [Syncephalis plumigaleata]